jgi:hypothetical protein
LPQRLDSYIYPGIVSNLLKNNNAQEGLKHWDIIQNDCEGFGSGLYNNSVLPQVQSFGTLVGRFPVENRLTMLCASSFNSTSRNR